MEIELCKLIHKTTLSYISFDEFVNISDTSLLHKFTLTTITHK